MVDKHWEIRGVITCEISFCSKLQAGKLDIFKWFVSLFPFDILIYTRAAQKGVFRVRTNLIQTEENSPVCPLNEIETKSWGVHQNTSGRSMVYGRISSICLLLQTHCLMEYFIRLMFSSIWWKTSTQSIMSFHVFPGRDRNQVFRWTNWMFVKALDLGM